MDVKTHVKSIATNNFFAENGLFNMAAVRQSQISGRGGQIDPPPPPVKIGLKQRSLVGMHVCETESVFSTILRTYPFATLLYTTLNQGLACHTLALYLTYM